MSKSTLKLYAAAHIAVLLLLLSFLFFAVPTADDYAYATRALNYSPVANIINEYNHWAARYTQVLISSIRYRIFPDINNNYSIFLIFYLLTFILGIYYFVKTFAKDALGKKGNLLATLLLTTCIIKNLPTLDESFFWDITGTTYILPAALLIILFTYLCKHNDQINSPYHFTFIALLVFFISGLIQISFITTFILFTGRLVFRILHKKLRTSDILLCLVPLIPGIIIYLCPGRLVRMGCFPESGNLVSSIIFGILSGTQAILQSAVDPYVWGSIILFLPLFRKISDKYNQRSLKEILLYLLIFAGMLYSIELLHYYGTGHEPVKRLMTVWYIIFIIGLLPLTVISIRYLEKFYSFIWSGLNRILKKKIPLNKIVLVITLLSLFLINNPPKAVYDLIYNIPGFLEENRQFIGSIKEQLKDPNCETLYLKKFTYDPLLLKIPTDADYGFSSYYNVKKTVFLNPGESPNSEK